MTYRVYADVILIQNLAADYLLLSAVKHCLRLPERRCGRAAGSVLGALYALGTVLLPLPLGYGELMAADAVVSILMVSAAFTVQKMSEVLEASAGLYIASMLTAGCMELARPIGGVESILFWMFAAGGSFFIPSAVWRLGMKRFMKAEHMYEVVLFNRGRTQRVQAILDTGNHLRMPLSGRPVQILEARAADNLFQWEDGVQYIPFRSVGRKNGVIAVYQADRMEISGQEDVRSIEKPWIAISEETLSQTGNYQMLLHEAYWL